LLDGIGSFLLGLQLHRACNFVVVLYLDLLHDALWIFGRDEGAEVEESFIYVEDVRFDHIFNTAGLLLVLQNELLFEDGFEVLGVDARNA
jgi:hypothetical protein